MKMKRYAQLSLVPFLLGSPSPLLAGDIDSSTDPANTFSYTIGDICNRLESGAAGSQISFTEPTADPAPTGCTLNEMMNKAPVADNTDGALLNEVLSGKTFWSLRTDGTWGQQTGTSTAADTSSGDATAADIASGKKAWVDGNEITGNVPAGDNVTGTDGQKTITIPDALYSGSKTATANDTDLTVGNIKSGVNIFGVAGTYTCTCIGGNIQNTSSGDAVAGEILSGKKAWVDGSEVTGTLATQTPTNTTVNQPAGNYNAFDLSTVDTDLATGNIKSGVTIFGVAGDANVVNTDTGDAVAGEILTDKKAWVDGSEITGTRNPAPVAKTGQTKCYDNSSLQTCPVAGFPRQDGDLQKGVTWPNPRFTDNSNGTVTDNLTGLIWLKNANCANGTRNWQTALNDVVQLNTNGRMNGNDCGDTSNGGSYQTDWRLPNYKELFSLIDAEYFNPALSNAAGTANWTEGDAFSGVQTYYYWSSTTYVYGTTYAWYVNLSNGYVGTNVKTSTGDVWPLRGGQ